MLEEIADIEVGAPKVHLDEAKAPSTCHRSFRLMESGLRRCAGAVVDKGVISLSGSSEPSISLSFPKNNSEGKRRPKPE